MGTLEPQIHGGALYRPAKGETANPKGKTPGTIHLSTHIQRLMEDDAFEANILDAKTGIKEYRGAPIKAIIQVAITKAVNGDDKAREWLAKYGWGTKQEIDVTSKGEKIGTVENREQISKDFDDYLKSKDKA